MIERGYMVLRDCSICNSSDVVLEGDGTLSNRFIVVCRSCGFKVSGSHFKSNAIWAWNGSGRKEGRNSSDN